LDWSLFSFVNGLAGRWPALDTVMVIMASYGPLLLAVPLILLWFTGSGETRTAYRQGALRAVIAAVLALIEILYVVFGRPQWLLASALAFVVLVLAVMGIRRVRPGIVRDGLIILAIAQGLVLVIPIAITASFALGLLLAVLVIIGVVIAAFRLRA